jgi:hypothetical protein
VRAKASPVYRAAFVPSMIVALLMWLATPAGAAVPSISLDRTIRTSPFANSSTSMKDAEGSAYVPKDDSIWLADDNGRAIYEVDPTSGSLKRMIGSAAFEATPRFGGGPVAGSTRDRDIESMAYDAASDVLYVFSGFCCSGGAQPAAFRLSRVGGAFELDSYQPLSSGSDYTASGWNPADQKLYVGAKREIRSYNYASNTAGPTFQVPNVRGILGMSFSTDGHDMFVAHHSSSTQLLTVVNFETRTIVPGWSFVLNSFGIRDARAVEKIGDRFFVLDGYDGRSKGDPLRHALYVFDVSQ